MHITLVSTDDEIWASGMRSISSALRGAGHRTTMVFAGETQTDLNDAVIGQVIALARDSEVIGISSMSRGSSRAKTLIAGLRPLGRLIVWGGMHPTLYPADCADHADLVCRGEGENFMLDLVERIESKRSYWDIPNGAYVAEDGHLAANPLRPLIADLDELPVPDFAFEGEYLLNRDGVLVPNAGMRDAHNVLFSGSRGCNNSCAYCSNSQLKALYSGGEHYARRMSVSHFVDQVKRCKQLFPRVNEFYFTDEDFLARPVDEIRELANSYPTEIGVPFEVMASPRQTTQDKVTLAVQAGMWRIDIGLESGSERTRREVFHRYVDDETQMRAAQAVHEHPELVTYYFLILGNPYEERQDLLQGFGLLRKMPPPFFLRAYNLVFIPGTKLFDRAVEDGIIKGIDDSASEMDFLAGFDHRGHPWKRKNLYLNSLASLMVGKFTRRRMGYVPRFLVTALTSERVVEFCERHDWIGEAMVAQANLGLKMRRAAITVVELLLQNRRVAYGIKSVVSARRLARKSQVADSESA
jgi:anaerobic magnesium-protoporphyrin IX monomethyl ester cyclase